jgi:hypothetical protein
MNELSRSFRRVAAFLAALLPAPPPSEAGPPDVDGFRDRDVDAQATRRKMEALRKDGHGGNR